MNTHRHRHNGHSREERASRRNTALGPTMLFDLDGTLIDAVYIMFWPGSRL